MDERLLREVVERLLADPQMRQMLSGLNTDNQNIKPECLIAVDTAEGVNALAELKKQLEPEYSLRLCVVGNITAESSGLPLVGWEQAAAVASWKRVILPVCSSHQLACIAMGIYPDRISELAALSLLHGTAVEIRHVNYGFTEKTPEEYRDLFNGYAKRVEAFGIAVGHSLPMLGKTQAQPWGLSDQSPGDKLTSPPEVAYPKRLLTDKEANLLPKNAVLRIAKATVLTPSAIDVLKRQQIEVYREGVKWL